jgi:hypothetical protein
MRGLSQGVDPRGLTSLQNGETPLIKAAYWGHTSAVVELVRLGADVNATEKVRDATGSRRHRD